MRAFKFSWAVVFAVVFAWKCAANVTIVINNNSTSALGDFVLIGVNTGQNVGIPGSASAGGQVSVSANPASYNDTAYYAVGYCDFGSVATTGHNVVSLSSSSTGTATFYVWGGGCGGTGPVTTTNYCWTVNNFGTGMQAFQVWDCSNNVQSLFFTGANTLFVPGGQSASVCVSGQVGCTMSLQLMTNGAPCDDGSFQLGTSIGQGGSGTANYYGNYCGGGAVGTGIPPNLTYATNTTNGATGPGISTNVAFMPPTNGFGTNVGGLGTGTNLELESTAEVQTQMEYQTAAAQIALQNLQLLADQAQTGTLSNMLEKLLLGSGTAGLSNELLAANNYLASISNQALLTYGALNQGSTGSFAQSNIAGLQRIANLLTNQTSGLASNAATASAQLSVSNLLFSSLQGMIALSNSLQTSYSGSFAQVSTITAAGASNQVALGTVAGQSNNVLGSVANQLLSSISNSLAGLTNGGFGTNGFGITNFPTNYPDAAAIAELGQIGTNTSTNTALALAAYNGSNVAVQVSNAMAYGQSAGAGVLSGVSNTFTSGVLGMTNGLNLGTPSGSVYTFALPNDGVSPANLVIGMSALPSSVTDALALIIDAVSLLTLVFYGIRVVGSLEESVEKMLSQGQLHGSPQAVLGTNAQIVTWAVYVGVVIAAFGSVPTLYAGYLAVFSSDIASHSGALSALSSSPVWPMVTAMIPVGLILTAMINYWIISLLSGFIVQVAVRTVVMFLPA